jgi:hypothetical protein
MLSVGRISRAFQRRMKDWELSARCVAGRKHAALVQRLPQRKVLFYPETPARAAAIFKICHWSNCRITTDPIAPRDLAIVWDGRAQRPLEPTLTNIALQCRVVNIDCRDVSKTRVAAVFRHVFGYALALDPQQHRGPAVRKSEANATHDGAIVQCPIQEPDVKSVYQIVVNNESNGYVEDIRVPYIGGTIPFAYVKRRPKETRFANENTSAQLVEVDVVFSELELKQLKRFCREMSLDYGELDVLRDRDSERIYIVDVNPTPFGPPNHIGHTDFYRAVKRMAGAFQDAILNVRWK